MNIEVLETNCEVRRSQIHGYGVFAKHDIKKASLVVLVLGILKFEMYNWIYN